MTATMQWYVIRCQTGREGKIRDSLLKRVKACAQAEKFGKVLVPTEGISSIRGGKKHVRERKIYPGYLMVEMDLDESTWFLVRETPGIGDFIGGESKPIAMQPHEVARLLDIDKAKEEGPKIKIEFKKGDTIKIKEGPFQNFDGVVEEIQPQKGLVKVSVTIFGRQTPVELEYWQVEAV